MNVKKQAGLCRKKMYSKKVLKEQNVLNRVPTPRPTITYKSKKVYDRNRHWENM